MNNRFVLCFSILMTFANFSYAESDQLSEVESQQFSDQELDQILAPIALYPDSVLAHILIAATYPLEVVQAARWTEKNPQMKGESATQAVDDKPWDPSIKALVAVPTILQRMSGDLDWLQQLGNAVFDDEEQLAVRIQNLRQSAYDEGNLDSLEHMRVVRDEETIIIEPTVREIVYLPYYDSRYIYGSWRWASYPPVYWYHPFHNRHHRYRTSIFWGPSIHLNWGFFFGGFHWHNHHIRVIDRHRYADKHYYSSRQIARHRDARRWYHNPRHRRNVHYHNNRAKEQFRHKVKSPTKHLKHHQLKRRGEYNERDRIAIRNKALKREKMHNKSHEKGHRAKQLERKIRHSSHGKTPLKIAAPQKLNKETHRHKKLRKHTVNRPQQHALKKDHKRTAKKVSQARSNMKPQRPKSMRSVQSKRPHVVRNNKKQQAAARKPAASRKPKREKDFKREVSVN